MVVVETTSTNGGWKAFSSTNATLATAISEVINALELNQIPISNCKISITYASTVYAVVAIIKKH